MVTLQCELNKFEFSEPSPPPYYFLIYSAYLFFNTYLRHTKTQLFQQLIVCSILLHVLTNNEMVTFICMLLNFHIFIFSNFQVTIIGACISLPWYLKYWTLCADTTSFNQHALDLNQRRRANLGPWKQNRTWIHLTDPSSAI